MIIKLTAINDDFIGQKKAIQVVGEKVDGGGEWSRKFFGDNKRLRTELDKFGVGETVNVKLVQKGDFWNVDGFSAVSAETVNKITEGNAWAKNTSVSPKWNGRTGEAYDRSAAIYLALDLLKSREVDLIDEDLYHTADLVYDYIHNGVNPCIDPLDPPVKD